MHVVFLLIDINDSIQGDYIWIEPISGSEFDVAIGARVVSAEGRRIQVKDDDNKVMNTIFLFTLERFTKRNEDDKNCILAKLLRILF